MVERGTYGIRKNQLARQAMNPNPFAPHPIEKAASVFKPTSWKTNRNISRDQDGNYWRIGYSQYVEA